MSQKKITQPTVLGVIGGSGLYQIKEIEIIQEHSITTPFGDPSDLIIEAKIGSRNVYFLPRHGRGHRFLPSEVNYRANIYAMKSLGVNHILAVSAVGIMKKEIKPGELVLPDQLFDRTKGIRPATFFGAGIVGHISFADPFCHAFSETVKNSCERLRKKYHMGGTYVCMEGPQFSTRAESHYYRKTLEPSVIGMTALPEAKLAREAEMCYSLLALATDYDCWNEEEGDVNVETVMNVLRSNVESANQVVLDLAKSFPNERTCSCFRAAENACMTAREFIPANTKQKTSLLYGKYWN